MIETLAEDQSIYIQSHIDKNIYKVSEEELKKGTLLLCVGTPCQIAAIDHYNSVKQLKSEN